MRIAAAQLRPAWLDKTATTKRTLAALEDAAAQNVELVAFPETWPAGYVADIDVAAVRRERQSVDPTGHYGRPDVFPVTVDRRRRCAASFLDD